VENHQGFWGGEIQSWKITVGEVDWSEPSDRVHRAVNAGNEVFEEVVIFFSIILRQNHNRKKLEEISYQCRIF
jgi:hypothetical protein